MESVYTGNCIIPMHRDESLRLRQMNEEKFFVYILQSLRDFSFYTGQCSDLDRRVSKHNDGMSRCTASKKPWRLVFLKCTKPERNLS
jgi:predicted GIY-YIG superfamily endonuclease